MFAGPLESFWCRELALYLCWYCFWGLWSVVKSRPCIYADGVSSVARPLERAGLTWVLVVLLRVSCISWGAGTAYLLDIPRVALCASICTYMLRCIFPYKEWVHTASRHGTSGAGDGFLKHYVTAWSCFWLQWLTLRKDYSTKHNYRILGIWLLLALAMN